MTFDARIFESAAGYIHAKLYNFDMVEFLSLSTFEFCPFNN